MLRRIEFAREHLKLVESFDCGDEYYSAWIRDPFQGALFSISKHGNSVWLYVVEECVVGYGSLGLNKWRFPPPDGPKQTVGYIPMLAVASAFQGMPLQGDRYSTQIILDLKEEAKRRSYGKLCLMVHEENTAALRCYTDCGFEDTGWKHNTSHGDYLKMIADLK